MKLIPKRQNGGSFLSLFADYIPLNNNSQPTQSSQQTKSKSRREDDNEKGKLTEKDLFTLLKDVDGLPNEMRALVSDIQRMYSQQSLYENDIDTSGLANLYAQNIYKLKHANFNKAEYDKAYKEAEKNEGLNEFAISASGKMIVYDKDKNMTQVSVSEFLNNQEEYSPVTNSNLLWLRAHDPSFVNNNQIFDIIQNGIGINKVEELIRDRMQNLGTNEQTNVGYTSRANGEIRQGVAVLEELSEQGKQLIQQGGMTLDGLYKTKVITKDQQQQALAALKYIYQTLPNNAKAVLQLRSGNEENPAEGAIELIGNMIMSKTSSSHTVESDYQENLNPDGTKKSTGKESDDGIKTDPYYNMARSTGGEASNITINKGTNYEMNVNGTLYSSLPGQDGKPIGQTSLRNALQSGLQGVITDPKAITFGNVSLTSADFDNIMFDGSSGGTLAILPTKQSVNGTKMVDLEALDRWESANKQLREIGISSIQDANHQQEIAQVLYENQLEKLVNVSTGSVDYSALGQFMIVDGYAVDNSGKDKFRDSSFVTKVDDTSDEILLIERALSTDKDQSNYKIDIDNWYDWNGHDTVYKGSIYIPITSNQLKALTASGQHIKEGPAIQKEQEYQMLQKRLQARQPKLEIL